MTKLNADLVSKSKSSLEYNSRTKAAIDGSGKTKLSSVEQVAKTELSSTEQIVEGSKLVKVSVVQRLKTLIQSAFQFAKTKIVVQTGLFLERLKRTVPEIVVIFQSYNPNFGKNLQEASVITDLKNIGAVKNTQENTAINDFRTIQAVFIRTPIEFLSITDSTITQNTKLNIEPISITDSFYNVKQYYKSLTEFVIPTDDINGSAVDDDQNIKFFKNTVNITSISDLVVMNRVYNKQYINTASITEILEVVSILPKSDSTNITDIFSKSTVYLRPKFEQTFITDNSLNIIGKNSNDSIPVIDTITKQISFNVTYFESIGLSDIISGSASDNQKIGVFKNTSERLAINDSISLQSFYPRVKIDPTNIVDSTKYQYNKVSADTFSILDLPQKILSKSLSEATTIVDLFNRNVGYTRNIKDTVSTSDDISGSVVGDNQEKRVFKNLTEFTAIRDTTIIAWEFPRIFSDSNSISDNSKIIYFKNPEDLSSLYENISLGTTKPIIESTSSITDTRSITNIYLRSVFETIPYITDIKNIQSTKNIDSYNVIFDNSVRSGTFVRTYQDYNNLTDLLLYSQEKNLSDSSNITDYYTSEFNKLFYDSTDLVDLFRYNVSKPIYDTAGTSEVKNISSLKILTEYFEIVENTSIDLSKIPSTQLVNLTEQSTVDFGLNPIKTVSISDFIPVTVSKPFYNYYQISENASVNFSKIPNIESLALSETVFVNFGLVPIKAVNLSDYIDIQRTSGIQETSTVISSGKLTNQNYGTDYFLEDYVGVSISFS